ncbi:serine hydrolase [Rhodopseudomonas sp. AAP120]|uniref:serine hydrolase domain-containing protein n=1 Tax=Rhodopseudomonas sp. AAP120 TaxID=1523430 RepID=UPI0006B9B63A|nr:serine hydrolase [Rhodopseudomonas sp. AAP120]KPF96857.1 serine hydrolase [Rhodopseudomonas sp. AAP120]
MRPSELMRGSPAAPQAQVTRANWRTFPAIRWGFTHAREILPTAAIRRAAQASPLPMAPRELAGLGFVAPDGTQTSVAATLQDTFADALLVMHRGTLVHEWYGDGMTATTPHLICSVTKSITGTLGGILVERGLIDPDALVVSYLPELKGSAYDGGCTVRHLLDMTVGIAFEEDYEDPAGDVARYRYASGWDLPPPGVEVTDQRSMLAKMRASGKPHGQVFHYVSPNTDALGWLYERACGASYSAILSEYLWQPMGAAEDASMTLDALGASRSAGGISATARDLARFGEMIRCRGNVGGRQVVPGWWIDDIHANGDSQAWADGDLAEIFPGARYRSKWYTIDPARGDLAAIGIHGQWIYVDVQTDTVIVKLATQPKAMDIPLDHRWLAAYRAIAAHVAAS